MLEDGDWKLENKGRSQVFKRLLHASHGFGVDRLCKGHKVFVKLFWIIKNERWLHEDLSLSTSANDVAETMRG